MQDRVGTPCISFLEYGLADAGPAELMASRRDVLFFQGRQAQVAT